MIRILSPKGGGQLSKLKFAKINHFWLGQVGFFKPRKQSQQPSVSMITKKIIMVTSGERCVFGKSFSVETLGQTCPTGQTTPQLIIFTLCVIYYEKKLVRDTKTITIKSSPHFVQIFDFNFFLINHKSHRIIFLAEESLKLGEENQRLIKLLAQTKQTFYMNLEIQYRNKRNFFCIQFKRLKQQTTQKYQNILIAYLYVHMYRKRVFFK